MAVRRRITPSEVRKTRRELRLPASYYNAERGPLAIAEFLVYHIINSRLRTTVFTALLSVRRVAVIDRFIRAGKEQCGSAIGLGLPGNHTIHWLLLAADVHAGQVKSKVRGAHREAIAAVRYVYVR